MGDEDAQWAWMEASGEAAYGPFDSIDEAVANAREQTDSKSVVVGKITLVRPGDWARDSIDADFILEQMDEQASDEFVYDDPIFVIDESKGTPQEAQIALEAAMESWAEQWVAAQCMWYLAGGTETVIR